MLATHPRALSSSPNACATCASAPVKPIAISTSPAGYSFSLPGTVLIAMELASLGVAYMAPCAVSSYPMAQQMGGDGELAGELVVFTTAFSIFTVFGFMYAMKSMGLI